MRPKAILAIAILALAGLALALAGGWLAGVDAQTPTANRARPATQGSVDDLRADLAAINRELASLTRLMTTTSHQLQEIQENLGSLRRGAADSRDRIAEAGTRIAETGARVAEIAAGMNDLRGAAGTALVSIGLGGSPGPTSQAIRDAAAQTCEALASPGMASEVVYAQSGAGIGASQVVCRLRPR